MLPFVIQPARKYETVSVGNAEIGVLEIEKYGDLTMPERRFIKEQNLFNYAKELATLAKEVSHKHGDRFAYVNDRINAYIFGGVIEGDVVAVDGKEGRVIGVEYDKAFALKSIEVVIDGEAIDATLDQIELISPEWYSEYYQQIQELTTAFLESLRIKNIVHATAIIRYRLPDCADWTVEKTSDPKEIHPQLVEEISSFAYKELNGWEKPETTEPKPSTDEELGKSSQATTK